MRCSALPSVRSITQPSPLGKVDCEARRMRLRCANNPSASLCSAPPFAQGRRKPHPPQAVLVATRSHSRENDTQSFSNALVPLRYPSPKGSVRSRLRARSPRGLTLSPLRGALPEGEPKLASHFGGGGTAGDGEGLGFATLVSPAGSGTSGSESPPDSHSIPSVSLRYPKGKVIHGFASLVSPAGSVPERL